MKTALFLFLALLGGHAYAAQPSETTREETTMASPTCEQCNDPMQPSDMPGVERWCPSCGAIDRVDVARAAYEGYAQSTGGTTFDGRDMPTFAALPDRIKAAWADAERAAFTAREVERAKVRAGLTFGAALERLKSGERVARDGWNGKGMWLVLIHPGNAMHTSRAGSFDMQPCIGMKTAQGTMQPGWLASQADMLATDWQIVTS